MKGSKANASWPYGEHLKLIVCYSNKLYWAVFHQVHVATSWHILQQMPYTYIQIMYLNPNYPKLLLIYSYVTYKQIKKKQNVKSKVKHNRNTKLWINNHLVSVGVSKMFAVFSESVCLHQCYLSGSASSHCCFIHSHVIFLYKYVASTLSRACGSVYTADIWRHSSALPWV